MKQKITTYTGLGFFGLLFIFLIWGMINLLSNFSVQNNGILTFLSIIIPHGIALGYIGFNLVVFILKAKNIQARKPVVPQDTKK